MKMKYISCDIKHADPLHSVLLSAGFETKQNVKYQIKGKYLWSQFPYHLTKNNNNINKKKCVVFNETLFVTHDKMMVMSLAVGVLLNIYQSYANDKISDVLIAPSIAQNPFLRQDQIETW